MYQRLPNLQSAREDVIFIDCNMYYPGQLFHHVHSRMLVELTSQTKDLKGSVEVKKASRLSTRPLCP